MLRSLDLWGPPLVGPSLGLYNFSIPGWAIRPFDFMSGPKQRYIPGPFMARPGHAGQLPLRPAQPLTITPGEASADVKVVALGGPGYL